MYAICISPGYCWVDHQFKLKEFEQRTVAMVTSRESD